MRVIAGTAGGLRLAAPEAGVRPTMDRVKSAIFSSLGDRVPGARILDLYAGSGSLGIEALSRGAADVVFVEKDRRAAETIEMNLRHTKMRGQIVIRDTFDFLKTAGSLQRFDIIFADPPYAKKPGDFNHGFALIQSRELASSLAENGIFILEIMPGEKLPPQPWFKIIKSRKYGKTETVYLELAA